MDNTFNLSIKSREGIVYKGKVKSLTSKNEAGKFDILAQHANFISLISTILEIKGEDGQVKEIKINNGLLRVKANMVEVYLGIEGLAPFQPIAEQLK